MKNPGADRQHPDQQDFEKMIERKSSRKLDYQNQGRQSPWFGLSMFGLIGWSVALPTLLGVLIGIWIDANWPSRVSWKLSGLFLGVIVGFSLACYWMNREIRK